MESSVGTKSKHQRTPKYDVATAALRSFLPTTHDSRKELLVSDLKQISNIMKRHIQSMPNQPNIVWPHLSAKKSLLKQTLVEIMQRYFPEAASLMIDPEEDFDSSDENL